MNRDTLLTLTRAAELVGVAESTIYAAVGRDAIASEGIEGRGGRDSRVVRVRALEAWRKDRIKELSLKSDQQSIGRSDVMKNAGALC